MRYVEFRDAIQGELRRSPAGLTWAALKSRLRLPYSTPCPEWVKQLEQEIGLRRERGAERAFTWKIAPAKANGAATTAKRPVQRNAGDWRAATLARMRTLILQAVPEMVEERKWRKPSNGMVGIPVWSHGGIVCTGETYAKVVKLTFAQGAKLPDPARLFNASLAGNTRRAIDIREGEQINARAFQALVKAAATLNAAPAKKARSGTKK